MNEKIECHEHGEAWKTYVCQHLTGDSVGLGFNRGEPTTENEFPDAWCDECQKAYEAHGGWNEESEKIARISLLCSSCYEKARIRNTQTGFKLQDLAGFRWKCTSCEEWHTGPCLDFSQEEPFYWETEYDRGDVACRAASLAELPKTFLNTDFCSINKSDFFIRGLIQLPILGTNEHFCWGVWGSLSRDNFERLLRMHDDPKRVELPKMFSWLSSRLPDYPDTLCLKMYAYIQPPYDRPYFELEPTEHPLAKEHHEGISAERVREIMLKQVRDFQRKALH